MLIVKLFWIVKRRGYRLLPEIPGFNVNKMALSQDVSHISEFVTATKPMLIAFFIS